jgi:hypothetical protein
MQKLITSNDRIDFDRCVNTLMEQGWEVLDITLTTDIVADTAGYVKGVYMVVLEKRETTEPIKTYITTEEGRVIEIDPCNS